jgi:hypothetical protein
MSDYSWNMRHVQLKPSQGHMGGLTMLQLQTTHRLYRSPQMHNLTYPPAKNTLGCCLNHWALCVCVRERERRNGIHWKHILWYLWTNTTACTVPILVFNCSDVENMRVSQMKTLNRLLSMYGTAENHGWYGVLIHDVRLCHSLLCSDFASRWFQLLQWPLVSLLGVPNQVKKSLLQN